MEKVIKTVYMNKPKTVDYLKRTFRFFGYTVDKERFTFNIKSHNYENSITDLFEKLNPNSIWQLNCELPGHIKNLKYFDAMGKEQEKTEHEAGKVKSIPMFKYQGRKH